MVPTEHKEAIRQAVPEGRDVDDMDVDKEYGISLPTKDMEESRDDYPKLKAKLLAKDVTLVLSENEYGYEQDPEYVLNGITAETWLAMQDNDDWVKNLAGNEVAKKLLSRGKYGLLYYKDRLVVPECLIDCVLRFSHDNNGHIGLEATWKMLERRLIWG